jgi:hypothetical protein
MVVAHLKALFWNSYESTKEICEKPARKAKDQTVYIPIINQDHWLWDYRLYLKSSN